MLKYTSTKRQLRLISFPYAHTVDKSNRRSQPNRSNGGRLMICKRILHCESPSALARLFAAAVITLVVSSLVHAQNTVPLINQPLVPNTVASGGPAFKLTVN